MTETRRALLSADVPVAERRLVVEGRTTAVLEAGEGPPLLLLHGGVECGAVYWSPVIRDLARGHRVVAPDVPGLGESDPLSGALDPPAFARWLRALVELTCADPPALVAHSMLGNYAARFAATHGALLDRLVLYDAPGIGPFRVPMGLRLAAIRFSARPSLRNLRRFERWPFADPARTRERDARWFELFEAYMLARAAVPHVKRTMRTLVRLATKRVPETELRSIQTPVALLWGRHDRMVPFGPPSSQAARLGWPFRLVEDAGHVPHIEQPSAFAAALGATLKELTP